MAACTSILLSKNGGNKSSSLSYLGNYLGSSLVFWLEKENSYNITGQYKYLHRFTGSPLLRRIALRYVGKLPDSW